MEWSHISLGMLAYLFGTEWQTKDQTDAFMGALRKLGGTENTVRAKKIETTSNGNRYVVGLREIGLKNDTFGKMVGRHNTGMAYRHQVKKVGLKK